MPSALLRIVNERGLHARAAAKFVALAGRFDAEVQVTHHDMTVDAEVQVTHHDMTVPGVSIMGLLLLGAGKGCEIEVVCEGAEAAAALAALQALVADGFSET